MTAAARDEAEADSARGAQQIECAAAAAGRSGRTDQRQAQEAASLREQLAAAQISRDAAISEAGGLRSELERSVPSWR